MFRAILAATFIALVFSSAAADAQSLPAAPSPAGRQHLLARLSGGMTVERYLQSLRQEFARMDADGDGKIDGADFDMHTAMAGVGLRAAFAMQIMTADLDGDGAVTADELRRKLRYDRRNYIDQNRPSAPTVEQQIETQITNFMKADLDKDGKITWNEAVEYAKNEPNYGQLRNFGPAANSRQILALAPAGKTSITLPEFEAAATELFRQIDTDNNGTISLDELDGMRKLQAVAAAEDRKREEAQKQRENCGLPQPSDAAKLILLGAGQTESLSSIALGSQDDVTGVGNIVIEPGEGPLYVVIAAGRPTIWRFYGATDRVERVVASAKRRFPERGPASSMPAAAVTGLAAEKVTFPKTADCLASFGASTPAPPAAQTLKNLFGREPNIVVGKYSVISFNAPSGTFESTGVRADVIVEKGGLPYRFEFDGAGKQRLVPYDGNLERDLDAFSPGGIVTLDAKSIVAAVPVEAYEVLPQEAGLLQLLKSGVLMRNAKGEYVINSKTRLPAGLTASHMVKFVLKRGVPEPDGDPGHSLIISEETGQPVPRKTR